MVESSLNGKLASFRLPDILTFLNLGRKTGTLTLLNSARAAHIHFSSGAIVFAWSNQKKFRLGKVLQKKKRIASDEARRIESIMLEQGEKFGRVAVEQNVLTEDELRDFLNPGAGDVEPGRVAGDAGLLDPDHVLAGLEEVLREWGSGSARASRWRS